MSSAADAPLNEQFERAAERVKTLSKDPGNDAKLKLYGLYKQATVGDNDQPKPSFISFEKRAKWDAWSANKQMSIVDAQQKYVTFVEALELADKK